MRGVLTVVSRRPLRIRRGDEGRPPCLCGRRWVAILLRPRDGVPRPPEVEVILVVPAVDRCVGRAQVLHCEQPGGVGGVEVVPCDELAGHLVPAPGGCALPPLGEVRLIVRPSRARGPAEACDLVELLRLGGAVECGWRNTTELRRALDQERLHPAHPWGRVEDRLSSRRVDERLPVPRVGVRHPLRWPEPAVVHSCREHCCGGCVACVDTFRLGPAGVDRSERSRVLRGDVCQQTLAARERRPLRAFDTMSVNTSDAAVATAASIDAVAPKRVLSRYGRYFSARSRSRHRKRHPAPRARR